MGCISRRHAGIHRSRCLCEGGRVYVDLCGQPPLVHFRHNSHVDVSEGLRYLGPMSRKCSGKPEVCRAEFVFPEGSNGPRWWAAVIYWNGQG